jgi:sugar lactone lactonase YvrE
VSLFVLRAAYRGNRLFARSGVIGSSHWHIDRTPPVRQGCRSATRRMPIAGLPVGLMVWLLLALGGCATVPEDAAQAVFYPPLPNPPRVQYLATFSGIADLGGKRSAFAEFVLGKGTPEEEHLVRKPYGAALYEGKIYVVDTRGSGYGIFDLAHQRFDMVTGSGAGVMKKPINITIDADGSKYITDTQREQVLAFDREDRFSRAFGVEGQFRPADVAIVGDRLYVADLRDHEIEVLDKHSGKVLFKIGSMGSGQGQLIFPTNLALAPNGDLWVSDTGNFRVQRFTPDGAWVGSFGSVGRGLGHFGRPKGVAVDHEGRVFVVDAAFQNVQIFDAEGRLLLFFGAPGYRPESINMPTDVVIDYDNLEWFQSFAHPDFDLDYVVLVVSQFGPNKVNAYGVGKMRGMDYSLGEKEADRE